LEKNRGYFSLQLNLKRACRASLFGPKRVPGYKVIEFYRKNDFITPEFTLTIFTRGLDLYFYCREVPGSVTNDFMRAGQNRRVWFETILL